MTQRSILRIGHRGAAGHAPENTLAALERGIALGADFLEVDLQQTRDGRIVLMHDKFVDRTTNGRGHLADLNWENVRRLDAGSGQRIPLLEEALEAASGRAGLVLECKVPEIGEELWRRVADFGFRGPLIFASFLHREILAIRELDAHAMTMALIEAIPVTPAAFALEARATHAGIALDSASPRFVEQLHDAGLQVLVYTADTEEQIRMAVELGVNGIISNYPERIPARVA